MSPSSSFACGLGVAAAAAGSAARARSSTEPRTGRIGVKIAPVVMDPEDPRNRGMAATLSAAAPPIRDARGALDFEALYRDCRDDVYAYVATLVPEAAAAEDVTALAFERAFRKRASWSARRGSGRAWLFGIARNAALDELRRRKRTAALAAEPEDVSAAAADADAEDVAPAGARSGPLSTAWPPANASSCP